MQITKELISKFFENKCSDIEVEAIILHFVENKERLDQYLSKEEWNSISADGKLDAAVTGKILKALKNYLFHKHMARSIVMKRKRIDWLVAASFLILVAVSPFFQKTGTKETVNKPVAVVRQPIKNEKINSQPVTNWQVRSNKSHFTDEITLQDGSIVTLFKNSSIRYPEPFRGNKREIILTGDASFEVAKNKDKPFTVYSGSLSTTALGTSFRVTIFDAVKKNIQVKLFTGKVIVRSTEKLKNWGEDIILQPGEEITYNGENTIVKVSKFIKPVKETLSQNYQSVKTVNQNRELLFNNTPLTEVLTDLSSLFNVKINYIKAEIGKMNFTGTINQTDELKKVLKLITQMNGLEINETIDGFTVIKPK